MQLAPATHGHSESAGTITATTSRSGDTESKRYGDFVPKMIAALLLTVGAAAATAWKREVWIGRWVLASPSTAVKHRKQRTSDQNTRNTQRHIHPTTGATT